MQIIKFCVSLFLTCDSNSINIENQIKKKWYWCVNACNFANVSVEYLVPLLLVPFDFFLLTEINKNTYKWKYHSFGYIYIYIFLVAILNLFQKKLLFPKLVYGKCLFFSPFLLYFPFLFISNSNSEKFYLRNKMKGEYHKR